MGPEVQHGADLDRHRLLRRLHRARRVALAPLVPLGERPAGRQIAVQRIVGAGLVGHGVRAHAARHQFRIDFGCVAEQADRDGRPVRAGLVDHGQRFVQIARTAVQIAGGEPHLYPARLALDREQGGVRHGRRQRLGAAHAAEPAGQDPAPGEVAAMVLAAHLDEGFVGALDDALAADIDPRAGRHLAEHRQALPVEFVEFLERRPVRHDVGIRDQHARRVGMGAKDADRLARLDQKGLVRLQRPQGRHDPVVAFPVARRPADAAIDHQLLRPFRDLGVQIVHQHAQRRFGQPALAAEIAAMRRADIARVVEAAGFCRASAHVMRSGPGAECPASVSPRRAKCCLIHRAGGDGGNGRVFTKDDSGPREVRARTRSMRDAAKP